MILQAKSNSNYKQESIPVGCVPSAAVAVSRDRGYTWSQGGVPGPREVSALVGVPGPGGVPGPRGVYLVPGVSALGGVPGPGGVYLVLGGCLLGGCTWSRGCTWPGGVHLVLGVYLVLGECLLRGLGCTWSGGVSSGGSGTPPLWTDTRL